MSVKVEIKKKSVKYLETFSEGKIPPPIKILNNNLKIGRFVFEKKN